MSSKLSNLLAKLKAKGAKPLKPYVWDNRKAFFEGEQGNTFKAGQVVVLVNDAYDDVEIGLIGICHYYFGGIFYTVDFGSKLEGYPGLCLIYEEDLEAIGKLTPSGVMITLAEAEAGYYYDKDLKQMKDLSFLYGRVI